MKRTKRDRLYHWEVALLVVVYWWCVVYPPLYPSGSETVRETYVLSGEGTAPTAGDGEGYVFRFRLLEWWDELTQKWI